MKTLVIYSSQTGFTKRYAEWLAEDLSGSLMTFEKAKQQSTDYFESFEAIIYGGWAMAGKIVNSQWFLENAENWKGKRLILFCVGASPTDHPDLQMTMDQILSAEEKEYIRLFYCPGGLDYSKMSIANKMMMKIFAAMLKKDKDPIKREQGEYVSHSYDISDRKYIQPIVDYVQEQ